MRELGAYGEVVVVPDPVVVPVPVVVPEPEVVVPEPESVPVVVVELEVADGSVGAGPVPEYM